MPPPWDNRKTLNTPESAKGGKRRIQQNSLLSTPVYRSSSRLGTAYRPPFAGGPTAHRRALQTPQKKGEEQKPESPKKEVRQIISSLPYFEAQYLEYDKNRDEYAKLAKLGEVGDVQFELCGLGVRCENKYDASKSEKEKFRERAELLKGITESDKKKEYFDNLIKKIKSATNKKK